MISPELSEESLTTPPPAADPPQDAVARQMAAWRDALIDLTRRNPLLSLPGKGRGFILLANGAPDNLLAQLTGRRSLLLAPAEEDEQEDGVPRQARRARARGVQTLLPPISRPSKPSGAARG